jgi:hypothetical protein
MKGLLMPERDLANAPAEFDIDEIVEALRTARVTWRSSQDR